MATTPETTPAPQGRKRSNQLVMARLVVGAVVALGIVLASVGTAGAGRWSDVDRDGISDSDEKSVYGTDPDNPDSDGDGLSDGFEVNTFRTSPVDPDTDTDGLSDGAEVMGYGTDPLAYDTDSDRLSDGAEVGYHNTDPRDRDTDGDGMQDGWEYYNGFHPTIYGA